MSHHVALALDGSLAQGHKQISLVLQPLDNSIADMHAAGEAVAFHAAGYIYCISKEAVARALHAYHARIGWPTVYPCMQ